MHFGLFVYILQLLPTLFCWCLGWSVTVTSLILSVFVLIKWLLVLFCYVICSDCSVCSRNLCWEVWSNNWRLISKGTLIYNFTIVQKFHRYSYCSSGESFCNRVASEVLLWIVVVYCSLWASMSSTMLGNTISRITVDFLHCDWVGSKWHPVLKVGEQLQEKHS